MAGVVPDTSVLVAAFCEWHEHLLAANLEDARVIALEGADYWSCLTAAAERRVAGGRTYDAIVVACAVRARVDRILTLNRRDFEPLVPRELVVDCPLG